MSVKSGKKGETTFVYEPVGKPGKVYLAGTFNDWDSSARRMVKSRDGTYRARMALEPGTYEYKFVVDGQWQYDPEAPELVPNEFGGYNSVVRV